MFTEGNAENEERQPRMDTKEREWVKKAQRGLQKATEGTKEGVTTDGTDRTDFFTRESRE